MNNETLLRVYCGMPIEGLGYLEILNPNLGFQRRKNIFEDEDIFDNFNKPILDIINNINEADYILIPHNYSYIRDNKEYLDNFISLSIKFNKKIIIFAIGDSYEKINIPSSIVIRMSQYKNKKDKNEIIIPAYAADLSYGRVLEYRKKQSIPVIGFCGWATLKGFWANLSFVFKNYIILHGVYRQGLFFRRKSIDVIKKSSIIKSNLIVRSSYGANKSTIELDPKKSREEYRNNIINSDFVLCPKGDGNYSVRFYETLSLGRIPILIDTDCPLPIEDEIDYSEFIIKIPYKNISKLDQIIADYYNHLSDEEWIDMQNNARKIFNQYLRIDIFFRHIFTKEYFNKYNI